MQDLSNGDEVIWHVPQPKKRPMQQPVRAAEKKDAKKAKLSADG